MHIEKTILHRDALCYAHVVNRNKMNVEENAIQ